MDARLSVIPSQAAIDPRLTALDMRILAILGREQVAIGFVRASRAQIAEWAHCAPNSVPRSVAKLEALGYVERSPAFDGKVQAGNDYRVIGGR